MPVIRPMQEYDLEAVQRIEQLSFSQPWPPEAFSPEKHLRAWVICEDDSLLGYIMYHSVLDESVIINFAIDPLHRRKGLGSRLLEETLGIMTHSGTRTFFLDVRRSNAEAQSLYGKYGFHPLGYRKNYYSLPDEDALVMVKCLDGESDERL